MAGINSNSSCSVLIWKTSTSHYLETGSRHNRMTGMFIKNNEMEFVDSVFVFVFTVSRLIHSFAEGNTCGLISRYMDQDHYVQVYS